MIVDKQESTGVRPWSLSQSDEQQRPSGCLGRWHQAQGGTTNESCRTCGGCMVIERTYGLQARLKCANWGLYRVDAQRAVGLSSGSTREADK